MSRQTRASRTSPSAACSKSPAWASAAAVITASSCLSMNVAATLASFGPFLGGYLRDVTGTFVWAFFLYALVAWASAAAVITASSCLSSASEMRNGGRMKKTAIITTNGTRA